MRIKFLTIAGALLLALGLSLTAANAGVILDSDMGGGDGIPDVFDVCPLDRNGPGSGSPVGYNNQRDTDFDGYGNACDCDFDQNNDQNGLDITAMFGVFLTDSPLHDMDGNHDVNGLDVIACLSRFLCPPGFIRYMGVCIDHLE